MGSLGPVAPAERQRMSTVQELIDAGHALPGAVVLGVSVESDQVTGTEGEACPVVVLHLAFQVKQSDVVLLQSFVIEADIARQLANEILSPAEDGTEEDTDPEAQE